MRWDPGVQGMRPSSPGRCGACGQWSVHFTQDTHRSSDSNTCGMVGGSWGKALAQVECGLLGQQEVAGAGGCILCPCFFLSLCPLSALGTQDGLSKFLLINE